MQILIDILVQIVGWVFRTAISLIGAVVSIVFAIGLLVAVPVGVTEFVCRPGASTASEPAVPPIIIEAAHRRPLVNTYLTYPEWYIVHAYEDFAGVLAKRDEHKFRYLRSIAGFWTSLCSLKRVAAAHGGAPLDTNVMLYVIGFSFTGEMAIKGAWEETIGRLFVWWRGPAKTAEDLFAAATAGDYSAFLRQTPWYAYPFFRRARQVWSPALVGAPSFPRKWERRLAVSLEFGGKGLYAIPIGWLAGVAPAELRIRSVVKGFQPADAQIAPGIVVVGPAPDGATILETPRYRSFTDIAKALANRNGDFVEIAGNRRVLITVVAPEQTDLGVRDIGVLFSLPIQSRPGYRRTGIDINVKDLAEVIRRLDAAGQPLEHIYDY
jgi:hypothetical protein